VKNIVVDAKWSRSGELYIKDNYLYFDTSNGEYGPCKVQLEEVKELIKHSDL
jgi:hypothetical protein